MTTAAAQGKLFDPEGSQASERHCRHCPRTLRRRQERFRSDECRKAWWDLRHPRINRPDGEPREGTIRDAILGYLADGEWRTKAEIAFHVRAHEHSVGSRLSELRRKGFRIESDATNGDSTRAHRFRLVLG